MTNIDARPGKGFQNREKIKRLIRRIGFAAVIHQENNTGQYNSIQDHKEDLNKQYQILCQYL